MSEGRSRLWITGASGGLGREIALAAGQRDLETVLTARGQEALEEVAEQVRGSGGAAVVLPLDVSREEAVESGRESIEALLGGLEALIHLAEPCLAPGPLLETPSGAFNRLLAVSLRGPFLCARAAARLMEPGGSIVVQVRESSSDGEPNGAPSVVRAGRIELIRNIEIELAAREIRVHGFDPGSFDDPGSWATMAEEIVDLALDPPGEEPDVD